MRSRRLKRVGNRYKFVLEIGSSCAEVKAARYGFVNLQNCHNP